MRSMIDTILLISSCDKFYAAVGANLGNAGSKLFRFKCFSKILLGSFLSALQLFIGLKFVLEHFLNR